jgi:general secretion pathway protein H
VPRPPASPPGFTLIELMVVLAVVAAAAALAVPALAGISGANARKAAGELAGTMRVLFDTAALRHATCRVALDLDHRAFWAECAPGPAGIAPGSGADDEALAQRFPDEADPEVRKVLAGSTFGKYSDRLVDRRELPGKAGFGPVSLEGRRDTQEAGTAYVYFFPGGQAQKAWVPIVDGKHLFTVVTEPFTGRTRVVAGKVEVRE